MVTYAATLLTLAAVFSYLTHRFIRLPTAIGIMLIAIVVSLALLAADRLGQADGYNPACAFLRGVDFHETLLRGMLSFLLFAGALHIDLDDLLRRRWGIGVLATAGVALSALQVGVMAWSVLALAGMGLLYVQEVVGGAASGCPSPS